LAAFGAALKAHGGLAEHPGRIQWPYQVRIASFNSGIDPTGSGKATAIQELRKHGLVAPDNAVDHRRSDCRGISRVVKSLESPFGVLSSFMAKSDRHSF